MLIQLENFPPTFFDTLKMLSRDFGFSVTQDRSKADLRVIVDPKRDAELDASRDIIVLAEPEVVRPDLYSSKFLNGNFKILPLGQYRATRLNRTVWIDWPVELPNYKQSANTLRKGIAIVNENKFSSSKRSQYGLRREVIKHFEKKFHGEFDLFGAQWNISKSLELRRRLFALRNCKSYLEIDFQEVISNLWRRYPSNVGHMESQCEQLQHYRTSICIENDLDYVSEKVWKSIYAGCPVVYVGPNLSFDLDLKEVVIQAEPSLVDILEKYESLSDQKCLEISKKARDFLSSKAFEKYSPINRTIDFYAKLRKLIELFNG